ncbi:prephenate dehydratase [Sulfurospirillum sp. 1612]|uniref:prephenate dehydratase n=1 Tax=Sulfurospirillum sp. 1612 TaxID=3094835 RepID=UPI002F950C7B
MNDKVIAYQGVEGAYSHLACKNTFPKSISIACESFEKAMKLVEMKTADFAMIPVENSTAGRVEEIYRLIPKLSLYIVKEHFEPVNHCLLGTQDARIEDIKYVGSHPQALAQCYKNIIDLDLNAMAKFDTAGSAKEVSEKNDVQYGAIASKLAAKLYNLKILQENFSDLAGNVTRFIILSRDEVIPEFVADKRYITSVIFQVRDIPAALFKALGGFATNGVNLLKLESYSMAGSMQVSRFHIDIDAHPHERRLKLALEELSFFANKIKHLGVYEKNPLRDQYKLLQ